MNMKGDFKQIIEDLQSTKPVLHHITNYVTADDCAGAALAVGASPVMADAPEEAAEITAGSDALVLNLGTLNKSHMEAMEQAAATASEGNIPVILDPVGVMSSNMRLEFAIKLLESGNITVVRGNYSECKALLEQEADGRGVDSVTAPSQGDALKLVKDAAQQYHCIFAMTGAVDYISDGKRALMINGGHPLMERIVGAGCMTTSIVAACVAVAGEAMTGAMLGLIIMGQAAELAAGLLEKKDGPGMFKIRLIDGLYHVVTKWNLIMDNLNPEKAN